MSNEKMEKAALRRYCPLCGCTAGANLIGLKYELFEGSTVCGDFSLVACRECGFCFYDTPSPQSDFDKYYGENAYYFSAVSTGSGGATPEDMRRFGQVEERLHKHVSGTEAAIFDVGCAKGGLLSAFRRAGYTRLYGVDMLPACVDHVKNGLGLNAGIGSVHSIPFPEVKADVLLYSQVAEHVVNLAGLIATATAKLADGGLVYIEVPDASRYKDFSAAPYYYLLLEHINHFDGTSLNALFGRNGFTLLDEGSGHVDAEPARWPIVWAVFRKAAQRHPAALQTNSKALQTYVDQCGKDPILAALAEIAQQKRPVHVWGMSLYALLALGQTPLKECVKGHLIDKNPDKQKKRLIGRPVVPPDVLAQSGPRDVVAITAVGFEKQIRESLGKMGFRGTIVNLRR